MTKIERKVIEVQVQRLVGDAWLPVNRFEIVPDIKDENEALKEAGILRDRWNLTLPSDTWRVAKIYNY